MNESGNAVKLRRMGMKSNKAHALKKMEWNGSSLTIPDLYRSCLSVRETEIAIKFIKDFFQTHLSKALNLARISAPIVVKSDTGVNDELNGVENPVRFQLKAMNERGEIVQSLAKWKRMALADYGFQHGEGLYTDMNAIRADETLDNLHSIYVDQWDWERIIHEEERNVPFLKRIVRQIYQVIRETEKAVIEKYPGIPLLSLPEDIFFIHSAELEEQYPDLPPKEREIIVCREHGAVFIMGIGADLDNGAPHDGRAADYDDWSTVTENDYPGLNGDILVWYPLLECAFELSSMGIRVDRKALLKQLEIRGEMHKTGLLFHKRLLQGELPLTTGGGIGQSRLCMLFLQKAHIGEVQAGLWPQDMTDACRKHGIFLL